MSEYRRLVSYIYLYDKGIKVKNSGFAKIECKDNMLRIKMNLKGIFNNYFDKWNVYLLIEGSKEMLGIYIGEIKIKGTSAEFQMNASINHIGNTSKSFNDSKGLAVISSGNKKYATFWEDTEVSIENFREYNEKEEKTFSEKINLGLDKMFNLNQARESVKKELVTVMEVNDTADKVEEQEKSGIVLLDNNPEEHIIHKKNEEQKLSKEELDEKNLNESWNQLIQQFSKINPFYDHEVECVRIELKDLRILPKSQWILSSNSFVLHGYYNYQYLILGKVDNKFLLGVPGVFCNKEKLVAGIFGFNDFKPAQVSEYKTGRFGYWYKYL